MRRLKRRSNLRFSTSRTILGHDRIRVSVSNLRFSTSRTIFGHEASGKHYLYAIHGVDAGAKELSKAKSRMIQSVNLETKKSKSAITPIVWQYPQIFGPKLSARLPLKCWIGNKSELQCRQKLVAEAWMSVKLCNWSCQASRQFTWLKSVIIMIRLTLN